MNGIAAMAHPAHVQPASVADSGDETAHTAGVLYTAISSRMQQPDTMTDSSSLPSIGQPFLQLYDLMLSASIHMAGL